MEDTLPSSKECKFLLLKVIEQAVRDFLSMHNARFDNERETWRNARSFIYDEEYRLSWGNYNFSLEDMLNILDLDVDYFRETATRRFKEVTEE